MLIGSELSIDLRDSLTPDLLHTDFITLSNTVKIRNILTVTKFNRIYRYERL